MFNNLHPCTTPVDLKSAITKHFPERDILEVNIPRTRDEDQSQNHFGFAVIRRESGERAMDMFGRSGMDIECEAAGGESRRTNVAVAKGKKRENNAGGGT